MTTPIFHIGKIDPRIVSVPKIHLGLQLLLMMAKRYYACGCSEILLSECAKQQNSCMQTVEVAAQRLEEVRLIGRAPDNPNCVYLLEPPLDNWIREVVPTLRMGFSKRENYAR